MEKPFKGRISAWKKVPIKANRKGSCSKGYYIEGFFADHEEFAGYFGWTSCVVRHNEQTGEIETRNSRYLLV